MSTPATAAAARSLVSRCARGAAASTSGWAARALSSATAPATAATPTTLSPSSTRRPLQRLSAARTPPSPAALGDQRRWFRLRDLFDADKARARRAAISEDIARGHFDDLTGAKTVDKPWPAVAFPPGPRRPALPPLQCVDSLASPSSPSRPPGDWRAWLAPGTLVLVGLRASAEAGLDSWAAAYAAAFLGGGGGGGGGPATCASSPPSCPPRVVDLTIYDRTPALALALPGMKAALLKGAADGARRRRAAVAAAHFGRAPELRAALRMTNALAAHAAVVGRVGGTAGEGEDGSGLGVAWLGSGVAGREEAAAMVAAAAAEGGWEVA